jgi:lipoprotein-releasing system ATP-binding protein
MGRSLELYVLKGIDLDAREGEIIAIIGPSGVGKSTFLHIIGALEMPSEGTVEIDGVDVYSYDQIKLSEIRNKTIGFVFQSHHLLPEFTALENILMPGLIAGRDGKELRKEAEELMNEVGLQNRMGHRPSEMSGGEQQRVAVARALINQPKLLLADEPSGNLDMQTADSLHELLWKICRQRTQTMIIVTHNLDLARDADRVIELYDGRVKTS